MPKSVRLTTEQERKLAQAAKMAGVSASDFIREAVEIRCDQILKGNLHEQFADLIGVVQTNGGVAHRTSAAFGELLATDKKRHKSG